MDLKDTNEKNEKGENNGNFENIENLWGRMDVSRRTYLGAPETKEPDSTRRGHEKWKMDCDRIKLSLSLPSLR